MPNWMAIDSKHGLISGVPLEQDLGPHAFTVTAHGSTATASDSFTIEVREADSKQSLISGVPMEKDVA